MKTTRRVEAPFEVFTATGWVRYEEAVNIIIEEHGTPIYGQREAGLPGAAHGPILAYIVKAKYITLEPDCGERIAALFDPKSGAAVRTCGDHIPIVGLGARYATGGRTPHRFRSWLRSRWSR